MKEKGVKPMAKRALLAMGLAGIMAAGYPTAVFAGEWRQDSTGYWWQNDDGSYPKAAWQWLDGNRDGVAECYYFGQDGYMAANTEIDGYQVNGDGAWTVDGVVQKMEGAAPVDHALENRKAKEAYKGVLEGEHMDGGYFHLLDINQDGIEEMLFNLSPWTTIYTYQDGQVEEIDTIRNDGYIYDRKNKRILSNYVNHGVENYLRNLRFPTMTSIRKCRQKGLGRMRGLPIKKTCTRLTGIPGRRWILLIKHTKSGER